MAALESEVCDIPVILRLTSTVLKMRIGLSGDGFIDAFLNEQTGTTAFALIQQQRRVFGADNTGGWHIHPFSDPSEHRPLASAISIVESPEKSHFHRKGRKGRKVFQREVRVFRRESASKLTFCGEVIVEFVRWVEQHLAA